MNRKQRRAAEKKVGVSDRVRNAPVKPILPLAPATIESLCMKYPDIVPAVEKFEEKCKVAASNDIFNLVFSCVLIALHDRHDFDSDRLNQLVSDAVNHIDCCSSGFVTKEDLIGLAVELGVKAQDFDFNTVRHNANQTNDRLRVYFERVEDMSKMEQAFKLFDEGVMDAKAVAEQTGSTIGSVYTYKRMWNQEKMSDMPIDEFTEQLFSANEVAQDKTERIEVDRVEEIRTKKKQINTSENKTIPKRDGEIVVENKVLETKKKVLEVPAKGRKFEVKRTIDITAEFGTYSITGAVVDVKLDTAEMGLTKTDLLALVEELQAVAGEM